MLPDHHHRILRPLNFNLHSLHARNNALSQTKVKRVVRDGFRDSVATRSYYKRGKEWMQGQSDNTELLQAW
jgi:hypothetical protein